MRRSQKMTFLDGEGDAWYARNHEKLSRTVLPGGDRALMAILPLIEKGGVEKILEIGCGGGRRLLWLSKEYGVECHGIEPSRQAVEAGCSAGVAVRRGGADSLPYDTGIFDLILFGFCLYLCDNADLFRIAAEADRVLRSPGWIVIHDFFSKSSVYRPYHHKDGVFTRKMDCRGMFLWHPDYECMAHDVRGHMDGELTDDEAEWVGVSVLRKRSTNPGAQTTACP